MMALPEIKEPASGYTLAHLLVLLLNMQSEHWVSMLCSCDDYPDLSMVTNLKYPLGYHPRQP